ncbi:hypothetical protein ACOI3P_18605, partial [Acinetobacter baumannii]
MRHELREIFIKGCDNKIEKKGVNVCLLYT